MNTNMTQQPHRIVVKAAEDRVASIGERIHAAREAPPEAPDMPTTRELSEPSLTAESVGTLAVKFHNWRQAKANAAAHRAAHGYRKTGPYHGHGTGDDAA